MLHSLFLKYSLIIWSKQPQLHLLSLIMHYVCCYFFDCKLAVALAQDETRVDRTARLQQQRK